MNISYDSSFNLVEWMFNIFSWGIIGMLAYRMNKRNPVKSKVWKILVCIFIGIFSFSINWNMGETPIKISILPLGVWMLYWFLKGKRWERYRSFAWLGFWANFIFLAATLLSIPVHQVFYPEKELSTYISHVPNASVIPTHPSAKEQFIDKQSLEKQINDMKPAANHGIEWYNEIEMTNRQSDKKDEKFPYQLIGFAPKWGSDHHAVIYIEADGKGLLVTTPKKQLYFRSKESLLMGGNKH